MSIITSPEVILLDSTRILIKDMSYKATYSTTALDHITYKRINDNVYIMEPMIITLRGKYVSFKTGGKRNSNTLVAIGRKGRTLIYFVESKSGIGAYLNYSYKRNNVRLSDIAKGIEELAYIKDDKKLIDECRIACLLTIMED